VSKRAWFIAGILAGGAGGALFYGDLRWKRTTRSMLARLDASRAPRGGVYREADLAGLPDPVQRYFRNVLRDGQPLPAGARVSHEGSFRSGDRWQPMKTTQVFSTYPPGFVWDARIRMAPGVDVRVRDAYLAGTGSMRAEVLALVSVMDAHGAPELDAGALQRYLGEAIWFPPALLPGRGVVWSAIDDSTARAALTDGKTTVSLDFRFNSQGEITGCYTGARYREVQGAYEPTPWGSRCWNYAERGGMRIPLEAEVEWYLPEGPQPYWRGRITEITYDYMR
jgi:hypothetical protein